MSYFAVRRARGPAWNAAAPLREQALWTEHATFMNALAAEGFVVLGGPLGAGDEVLLIVEASGEDVLRARLAGDPWSAAGLLKIVSVEPWTILLDGRSAAPRHRDLLRRAYDAFNARDLDRALSTMHPDVEWPNGMQGGYVHGRDAVRDYWTRQWHLIDPRVDPQRFTVDAAGRVVVEVRQVVRDLSGTILKDQVVRHVYDIEDGVIRRMEILPAA